VIVKILINDINLINYGQKKEINDVQKKENATEKRKIILRYSLFYPIMIVLLSYLSFIITIYQFKLTGKEYFEVSAILSLFLGYFIDNSKDILDKFKGN
jgi:uncharacterized membrane protein